MTDIKMLPLPVRNYVDGDGLWETATGPYSAEETQAHARAVAEHNVAARDAEIERLRAERDTVVNEAAKYAERSGRAQAEVDRLRRDNKRLAEALRIAEAALADIGDADREPGDDVEWCERRAALGLRRVRDTLRDHDQEGKDG